MSHVSNSSQPIDDEQASHTCQDEPNVNVGFADCKGAEIEQAKKNSIDENKQTIFDELHDEGDFVVVYSF